MSCYIPQRLSRVRGATERAGTIHGREQQDILRSRFAENTLRRADQHFERPETPDTYAGCARRKTVLNGLVPPTRSYFRRRSQ